MKKFNFILLWIIGCCGMLGLHRFYLGFKISGFIWLFTMGGFMIGSIYDILNINKLIAKSESNDNKSKDNSSVKKTKTSTIKNTTKQESKPTQKAKTWVGQTVKYIIIYKKGPQQKIEENLIGVRGQAEAKRLIEAKYSSDNVQRISWVHDTAYYE